MGISDTIEYGGKKFNLTWSDNTEFSKLSSVTQVYGVCFRKDGKILIVKVNNKWCLPGGKPEVKEKYEETLRREVNEEGDVELDMITSLGHIIVEEINSKNSTTNQLRFAATISKIKEQTEDPAHGKINERKFISPDEFIMYCPWGNTGRNTIKKATAWFKNIRVTHKNM